MLQSHKALAKSQKFESLGQLASGIAHELNTPVQYIGDNTHFVKDAFMGMNSSLKVLLELFEAAKAKNFIKQNIMGEIRPYVLG